MKPAFVLIGITLIAGSISRADDVLVQPATTSTAAASLATAFDACADKFASRLFPKQDVNVQTRFVIDTHTAEQLIGRYDNFSVKLEAHLKRDGSLLAAGTCAVSRDARVTDMAVRIESKTGMAGLTSKDISLAMAR